MKPRWILAGILLVACGLFVWQVSSPEHGSGAGLSPTKVATQDATEVHSPDDVAWQAREVVLDETESAGPSAEVTGPRVRVSDLSGAAIEGASVYLLTGMEEELVGKTDSLGQLPLPSEEVCDSIVVVHPDYARLKAYGGQLEGRGCIELVLSSGAAIAGTALIRGTGENAGADIVVHAWPTSSLFPDPREIARAGAGSKAVLQATTDDNGAFRLTGLTPGVEYTLAAAGKGLFNGWDNTSIPAGTEGVQLELTALYGLYFTFESPLGPASLPGTWAERDDSDRFISILPSPDVKMTVVADVIARLAGVQITDALEDTKLIVLQSPTPVDRIGPLKLAVRFPGYQPEEFDVWAVPLKPGMRKEVLPLVPTAEAFGSIQVSMRNAPEGVFRASGEMLAGMLYLWDESGKRSKIALPFSDLHDQAVLGGIPYGEYEAQLVGNRSFFHYPAGDERLHLTVGPDVEPLELDLATSGCVELELLDRDGWPELKRAGFLPEKLKVRGDKRSWTCRGTVTSRWSKPGERSVMLLDPGTYRFSPSSSVVGLDPVADPTPQGGLKPRAVMKIGPGETAHLLWQKLGSSR